jgi:cytosine/adenosine deaminase-related metal-dependent hydrolase
VIRGETAPLIPWLEAGITVGIGLDDNPDMIRFMQAAGIMAAYRSTWLGQGHRPRAQKLLELATIEAAKVVGLENEIGSLEVGKKADITIIDMRKPHLNPSMDPVMDLIYFGNGNDIETVIVDGQVVVETGQILTVDMYDVLKNAQSAGERAWNKFHAHAH